MLGARLLELSGVSRPLPFPLIPRLIALSLSAGGGAGFVTAAVGRLTGGTGAAGFAFTAGRAAPFATGGGGGGARAAETAGGGGASSFRYAEGAQPWVDELSFLASHQP